MDTKKDFWDSQAAKGELSGTQDRYAKDLEMQAIARYVKDGMRVLDVGCGDGETLLKLATYANLEMGLGLDYSAKMISEARGTPPQPNIYFILGDVRNLKSELTPYEPFDLIYTQRALINLDSWEEQRTAILDILKLLRAGGTYVMVECFTEGLDEINALRVSLGLEAIKPPWHNRYLKEDEVNKFAYEELGVLPGVESGDIYSLETNYFSGAYYFMSRVVNAWIAKQIGIEQNININPSYDHPLNRLGTLLPPECVNLRGQTQAWIVRKK